MNRIHLNTEAGRVRTPDPQLDITMVYVRAESGGLQGNLSGEVGTPVELRRIVREERERAT